MAGINRLNLRAEVKHVAPFEISQMIPAMGQGALGIEAVDEPQILRAIEFLKDERAIIETTVERDFVRVLEGGCQVRSASMRALRAKISTSARSWACPTAARASAKASSRKNCNTEA